jgi:ferredoxin
MEGDAVSPEAASGDRPVVLHLARKGRVIEVPAGQSLLNALIDAKVRVRHSCNSGNCGSCELKVLAGTPLHRDSRYASMAHPPVDRIRPCVSRSLSPELTLDL